MVYRFISQYATHSPVKKGNVSSKGTSSKSSNSWHVSSISSPDHSGSSEYRSLKRIENVKSVIEPCPEEEVKSVRDVADRHSSARGESHKRFSTVSHSRVDAASVSSAGDSLLIS